MDVKQWLSAEEIAVFTSRSDLRGFWYVAFNWLLIASIFWGMAQWSNPLSVFLGLLLLGGRQLGLAILMHEAGHGTLFRSPVFNRLAGRWLCAYPILSGLEAYALSHRGHHALAGSTKDPDLANYEAYPVSYGSFQRKIFRDVTGQTGVRNLLALFRGSGGDLMTRGEGHPSTLAQGVAANLVLAMVLFWSGVGELYLVWVVAYLTIYPLTARIRQLAEHGNVGNLFDADPRNHTRTTRGNWIERLFICPNQVNFHCEHHFMASVPCYRLQPLHAVLQQRGFYVDYEHALAKGYKSVLKKAIFKSEPQPLA